MVYYRIQSGRTPSSWLAILYSILTIAAFAVLFVFALPLILAIIAVLAVAGAVTYWRIKKRVQKMRTDYSSSSAHKDAEYVDFEVIEGEDDTTR